MAEHHVPKGNIIYIIPDDELFRKYKSGEAFIDDYGRLMNRKPNRVLRELKHYANNRIVVQKQYVPTPVTPVKKHSPIADYVKDTAKDAGREIAYVATNRLRDKALNEWIPNGVHWAKNKVIDLFTGSTEMKAEQVLQEKSTDMAIVRSKPKAKTTMTPEEIEAEKRKFAYHWLEMFISLKKLYNAGEDIGPLLEKVTDPDTLARVNSLLDENPNLLETDKYITLHDLLGRDLYKDKHLIPIQADEITTIAEEYGYEEKEDKTEDNDNGRQ